MQSPGQGEHEGMEEWQQKSGIKMKLEYNARQAETRISMMPTFLAFDQEKKKTTVIARISTASQA